jgi:uncharacterized protein YjbI with pentapeptide repeats
MPARTSPWSDVKLKDAVAERSDAAATLSAATLSAATLSAATLSAATLSDAQQQAFRSERFDG